MAKALSLVFVPTVAWSINFSLKWPENGSAPGAWQKQTQEYQEFLWIQFNKYMHKMESH